MFAKTLKKLMKSGGYNMTTLSEDAQVPYPTLRHLMKEDNFKVKTLNKLLNVVGYKLDIVPINQSPFLLTEVEDILEGIIQSIEEKKQTLKNR